MDLLENVHTRNQIAFSPGKTVNLSRASWKDGKLIQGLGMTDKLNRVWLNEACLANMSLM